MGLVSVLALVFATWALKRAHKLEPNSRIARQVDRIRGAIPAMLVLSVTTIAAGLQGGFERQVQAWHQLDFTHWAWAIEGNLVERFQDAARTPFFDYLFVSVYTAGSFLFYFVPFFILVAMGRGHNAMRIAATMAIIWAVGIVFYFFFPVSEVWMTASAPYKYTHVENVLFEHVPSARTSEQYALATNNNFPSLHVALTSGIATALWLGRERWLAIPGTMIAVGVAIATMYLGIHWLVDVIAGIALAFAAAWLSHQRIATEKRVGPPAWMRFRRPAASAAADVE